MAYVQRFTARGSDLVTLDYFAKNRLAADIPEVEMQQLVARQVYDLARARGVKSGNLTTDDLEYVYRELAQGVSNPIPSATRPTDNSYEPQFTRWGTPNYRGGDLLPRTAMQMPLESMRPASYFDSGDAFADSAGAFTYHLIDSLTLGLIGAAGGLLKRVGATEENFWTESIGGARNVLGMDFGEGGIKGGDSTAGQWLQRAGEVAGFLAPAIATGGGALLAKGATGAASKAARAAVKARNAGKLESARELAKAARGHSATAASIEKGAGKLAKGLSKMPASMLFEQGHRVLNRLFVGEATKGLVSSTLKGVVKDGKVLGTILKPGRAAVVEGAIKEATEEAGKFGYQAARGAAPKAMLEARGTKAAADVAEEVFTNPDITTKARAVFQTRFAQKVADKLGLDLKNEAHRKFLARLTENADDVFRTSFKEARLGGLKSLQEKAFAKGAGRLGMEFAKLAEESANHVTSMLALGLVTRVTHPLAEPAAFGIDEDDDWQATKDIAKYWLRGSGHGPFEGVTGDIFTGLMFASGGGLKLLPAFQKKEITNPWEVMSRMAGGDPGGWKIVMDRVDRELFGLYKVAGRAGTEAGKGGIKGFFRKVLGRNKTDFNALSDESLNTVAKNYLNFMEKNKDLVTGVPLFSQSDIMLAMRAGSKGASAASKEAREKIVSALNGHFDHMLREYGRRHSGALLRDMSRFAAITTATSFASSPHLWMAYAKGDQDIHLADLVSHTLFSGLMARQPYYMPGANPYIRAQSKDAPLTPEMATQRSMMQIKNAMRHLGMRDSALVLEGNEGRAPRSAEALGPLTSDDMVKRASERSADEGGIYKFVASEKDVTNGFTDITAREVVEYMAYLRRRHESGAEISDLLLIPDAKGEPTIFSGDLFSDPVKLDRIVQSLGKLKETLSDQGHMELGGVFDSGALAKANRSWYEQALAQVSNLMTAGEKGGRAGLLEQMKNLTVEGDSKGLREISIVDSREGVETTALTNTERMFNELVGIARDLGMMKVEVSENGNIKPRRINAAEEGELVDKIADFVDSTQKVFRDALGLETLTLGDKNVQKMLIEGLYEAKVMHSNVFSIEGGTLYDREGNAFNGESIKRILVEEGWAIDMGDGNILVRRVDYENYKGKTRNGVEKSSVIRNFLDYIENIEGVTINRGRDGQIIDPKDLEMFFSNDLKIPDARSELEPFKRTGGLESLMQDLGLPMDNSSWVSMMVRQGRQRRLTGADATDWRFLDAITAANLTRRDAYGNLEVLQPARSKRPGTGVEALDVELPTNYAEFAEAMARHELVPALNAENYNHFVERVNRLKDLGLVSGFSGPTPIEGAEIRKGVFQMYGVEGTPELTNLARELTYLANRSSGEALMDVDNSIRRLRDTARGMRGSKNPRTRRRQKGIGKLIAALSRIRDEGGYWFMTADRAMIESGILQFGESKKGKIHIPSDRKIVKALKDIERFIAEDAYRKNVADQKIDRYDAAQAAADIRKSWQRGEEDKPSVSVFMTDTGFGADGAIAGRAMSVIESIRANQSNMNPGDIGPAIRRSLNRELKRRYAGQQLREAQEALAAYPDNYLNSLLVDTAREVVDLYRFSPGTAFAERMVEGGPGEKPVGMGSIVEIPNQPAGNAIRTDYLVGGREVSSGSRDLLMRDVAKIAYVDAEGAGDIMKLKSTLYNAGLVGRSKDADLVPVAHELGPSILLREARQGGMWMAVEIPKDPTSAVRFIDGMEAMLKAYDLSKIQSEQLKEVIAETRATVKELRDLMKRPDAEMEIATMPKDMLAWERMFLLKQMDSYFGADKFIEAMNADVSPDANPLQTLMARANLSANGAVKQMIASVFDAAIHDYAGQSRSVKNDGTKYTVRDITDISGITVNENGRTSGLRVLVYDGGRVAEAIGREMPEMDSGIIMNRNVTEAAWHAYGYAPLEADGIARSLAKIRFLDHKDGLLATKDVISSDVEMQQWMEANNIAAIISKDAIKQYSGRWAELVDGATFRVGENRDLMTWISEGNSGFGEAAPMEIPIEAMRWAHPVDSRPGHASKSAQLTNLKTFEVVDSITKMIDAKQESIIADFKELIGDGSTESRMKLHALFGNSGRLFTDAEQKKDVNRTSNTYMAEGGAYASPMHYGGYDYYLDVLKKKLIDDQVLKIRTDNGSQAVYTADTRRVLSPGQVMLPWSAATKTQTIESGYVAFRVESPEAAAAANARTFEWGDRPNHYNEMGTANPNERRMIGFGEAERQENAGRPHVESDIAHFRLWAGGEEGGIFPGLMAMRSSDRDMTSRYRAYDQYGNVEEGMGAETIRRVMRAKMDDATAKAIASGINDAWQSAIKGAGNEGQVFAEVSKAVNGIREISNQAYKRQIVRELMRARELAGIGLYGDIAQGKSNQLTRPLWQRNGEIENFRAMNALSAIFGGYDYYSRVQNMTAGLGSHTFGLSVMTQRHPSTMINDTMGLMSLGFMHPMDGNQMKAHYRDAEMIMKADQDEDHIHFWHDFTKNELGGALRIRGITGGFTEPDVAPMPKREFFPSKRNERSYVSEWVDRQNDGKAGIGMISKAISAVSDGLHKEIAFEYGWGEDTILVAPRAMVGRNGEITNRGRVMEATQSTMMDSMNKLTMKHNEYLDTKAGSSEDPRKANLQQFVAEQFFGVYRKTADGKYVPLDGGLAGNVHASDALSAAMSQIYSISSIGKDAHTPEGSRSQRMSDFLSIAARYDAVHGPNVTDHARSLQDLIAIGLRDHLPTPTPKDLRRATDADRQRQIKSIRVITNETELARRTTYDAMSEAVLKSEGSIMSGNMSSFLTTAERMAYFKGNEAMKAMAPELKTAQAAHHVARLQGVARQLKAYQSRIRNGETMLITEAAAARMLLKEGFKRWSETEGDTDFNAGKRMQPQNNLEYGRAMNDTRDGWGVNLALTFANSLDKRPYEAQQRADEAFRIREWHKEQLRKVLGAASRDTRTETDFDTITAGLDGYVRRYMEKYGKEGNEVLAALELLRPQAFGYFIDRNGLEMVRYRRFPQAVLGAILRSMGPSGITATGHTPEWGALGTTNLMQTLARAAHTADTVMSGDPRALHEMNAMVGAIESSGRSVTTAIQFKHLDWYRTKKMNANMYKAALNSAFGEFLSQVEGSAFTSPERPLFGFGSRVDADFFLRAAVTDQQPALRSRIIQRQTMGKMGVPDDLVPFMPNTETATISIYEQRNQNRGPMGIAVKAGERKKLAAEAKPGEKITEEVREQRVRAREAKFADMMLRSIDARSEYRSETSTNDLFGKGLIDVQRELKFNKGECPGG